MSIPAGTGGQVRRLIIERGGSDDLHVNVSEFDVDDDAYTLLWSGAVLAGVFFPDAGVRGVYFAEIVAEPAAALRAAAPAQAA
jgi:hypothetical protein